MNILRIPIKRKINYAAFSNKLVCPHTIPPKMDVCNGTKWKFVENVSLTRIRFRCKKCGRTVLYDFSNNPNVINQVYGDNTQKIIEKAIQKYQNVYLRQPVIT